MFENLKAFFRGFFSAFKTRSTEYLEFEERELENVFALVLMGSFVGIPSPPTTLVMRLMPHMVREIYVMQRRAGEMDDIFGEIAAMFEIT
ncbi:hypothetical protein ADU37_CDS01750 [Thermococcus sp. 2319x1]|uniref:hypothetical protein n=1 Tax=Thermococcus sp. 2319x1 TaxID=1674923 RepID=UPI00073AD96F|nr:hypothetical protein [Thermococcus sp. 2319x1]ALV61874.1 hypothetical protein ADU37_CDS01750 [Thermococcus sp. 2319x1]